MRCIEHGLLIDDATARLVKENNVVISTQLMIYRLLGEIREGWNADVVLFNENPLEDLSVFGRPERSIELVIQAGRIVTDNR